MDETGTTIGKLSEATGINNSTLSNYINGRREPDIKNLARIAKAMEENA